MYNIFTTYQPKENMKNPFIQLETIKGDLVSINVTKITSVEKQKFSNSDEYCTYLIMDGGGGAYVATHHFKLQYEEVMDIINTWFNS